MAAALLRLSASMSSTLENSGFSGHDFSGAACIDGVWGGGGDNWSFCHNLYAEPNAWLSVEVEANALVSTVFLYGRSDCCQQNLANYEVWVGDAPGNPTLLPGMSQCQPTDVLVAPATVGPFNVSCGLVGSYVTLLLPGTQRNLMLDELVVLGRVLVPSPPPSAPSPPTPSPSPLPPPTPSPPPPPSPSVPPSPWRITRCGWATRRATRYCCRECRSASQRTCSSLQRRLALST